MKYLLLFILLISPVVFTYSQKPVKRKTPQIITKLMLGKTTYLGDKSIKFMRVLEDSRCPKNVNCIWAGQAKIVVGYYENDTLIQEKEIIFDPKNSKTDKMPKLVESKEKTMYGYTLSPYPVSGQKTAPSDYFIELIIK